MMRPFQIELWTDCNCHRCRFCLITWGKKKGVVHSAGEKTEMLIRALEKVESLEESCCLSAEANEDQFDSLIIKGGEILDNAVNSYIREWDSLIKYLCLLIKKKKLKRVFLVTSLKYRYDTSLLRHTLNELSREEGIYDIPLKGNFVICTSWDNAYRFSRGDRANWLENLTLVSASGLKSHCTTILTSQFIHDYMTKEKRTMRVISLFGEDFDLIPAIGKGKLDYLHGFLPKVKEYREFIAYLTKDNPNLLKRYINQSQRRASYSYFTNERKIVLRNFEDKAGFESEGTLPCGHDQAYANYADSDACSLCDARAIASLYMI